jgi:hypothetical protein
MDLPAEHQTSPSSRGEMVQAGGRMAVLVLFTALFAAAWNGDGRPAVALSRSGPLPRQAGRLAHAAAEVGTIRRVAVAPSAGFELGAGLRLACDDRPLSPFTGTPALLGGTIRSGEAAPVASSRRNGRL